MPLLSHVLSVPSQDMPLSSHVLSVPLEDMQRCNVVCSYVSAPFSFRQ
jgi:hypothetical protein